MPDRIDSPQLTAAEHRLMKALQQQPLDPVQAGVAGYLNGAVQSCRIDALEDLFLNPPDPSVPRADALEAAYLSAVTKKAEQIEQLLGGPRIQLAKDVRSALHVVGN